MLARFINPDGQQALAPFIVEGMSPHAYFEGLRSRPEHHASYALRSQAEIDAYSHGPTPNPWVTYDPVADAARIVIPPFAAEPYSTITGALTPDETTLVCARATGSGLINGRALRLGEEVMIVREVLSAPKDVPGIVRVSRGEAGTTATAHEAGTALTLNVNSLPTQVRLPVGTEDGHAYLVTMDLRVSSSFLGCPIGAYKALQLDNPDGAIRFETRLRLAGSGDTVGTLDMRVYSGIGGGDVYESLNRLGPGVTDNDPLRPQLAPFVVHPDRLTRLWWYIVQPAGDYGRLSVWAADTETDPVQLFAAMPIDIRPDKAGVRRIANLWLEWNTSQDRWRRPDVRDLVSEARNVCVLRDPVDVEGLLVRP